MYGIEIQNLVNHKLVKLKTVICGRQVGKTAWINEFTKDK